MYTDSNPRTPGEAVQDDYVLSVTDAFGVLRRRLWLILSVAVVLAALAAGISFLLTNFILPQTYTASVRMLVGQEEEKPVGEQPQVKVESQAQEVQLITQTLAQAVTTPPVAEEVIQRLDLRETPREFLKDLSAVQVPGTQFIDISYQDKDREKAQEIANTVGVVFTEQVSELRPSIDGVTVTVWSEALLPENPPIWQKASLQALRNGLTALLFGGMLGIGLAFLLELLDNSWRSPEEVERISGVPTFGMIPKVEPIASTQNVKTMKGRSADVTSAVSEAYRALRTNLLYAPTAASSKVIVVTSPGPEEGKSTICANLADVLARVGKNTLVMDCNLRKPAMHEIFELYNSTGMVDVLGGERPPSEVQQEPLPGLQVITAGPVPSNPAELLSSGRFAEFVGQARERFDYVLVDAPPTGLVSDPVILATQGDGVLLVIDSQGTRKDSIQQAVRDMRTVGARVLGTVMNKAKAAKGGY